MPNGLKAVSIVASLDFPSLFAQPGLVCPDAQGYEAIMLQNCGDSGITLPRCTNIGFVENLNDPQFEKLSRTKLGSQNRSNPNAYDRRREGRILSQAVLNVPNEEPNLY